MIDAKGFQQYAGSAVVRWVVVLVLLVFVVAPGVAVAVHYARTWVIEGPATIVECHESEGISNPCRAINMSDAVERESQQE